MKFLAVSTVLLILPLSTLITVPRTCLETKQIPFVEKSLSKTHLRPLLILMMQTLFADQERRTITMRLLAVAEQMIHPLALTHATKAPWSLQIGVGNHSTTQFLVNMLRHTPARIMPETP